MLSVSWNTIRLFLHVLAACVWVGGQIALAVVIPAVRPAGTERVRAVARRFQVAAWTAFAVLLGTGAWNLFVLHVGEQSGAWLATLMVKLTCVAITGGAAAVHVLYTGPRVRRSTTEAERRTWAALSGALEGTSSLFAIATLFLGILLHG